MGKRIEKLERVLEHEELSLYDAMMAEIVCEKARRMRKFAKTHEVRKNGQAVRKDKSKAYIKEKCYQCSPWNGWDIVRNVRIAEKIRTDAEDWEIELDAIIEDLEWERINAEIKAMQERERMFAELRKLNEWLKYA